MSWPLLLNTTTYCNAKCKFCIVYDTLNHPELNMTDEQVYETLRQSRANGSTEVGYSGGEPSIDPRIVNIVRYAKELGFTRQSMNTNGIKFKQKKFCEEILEAGLTSIDISVHGHTDELHDGLVVKRGALAAIREACANLRELQARFKFHLSATVVIARDNQMYLRDICMFLDSIGITHKRLKYAYEGNMSHDMIINQVAPYQDVVPSIKDALNYLATRKYGFYITHVPLCLLGEHAAFSQDFENRKAVMVFTREKAVGAAAHFFRKDGDACADCVVNNLCTRLDGGYERFHGRPALVPFASHEEVEAMFAAALVRFPNVANYVRHTLDMYRRNRDAEAPTNERVAL
jgi:pyruvate-formate lyase-activating enzyme